MLLIPTFTNEMNALGRSVDELTAVVAAAGEEKEAQRAGLGGLSVAVGGVVGGVGGGSAVALRMMTLGVNVRRRRSLSTASARV